MSLDIYLKAKRNSRSTYQADPLYRGNLTHNLTTMADEAGLYLVLWHPDEIGVANARQAIPHLKAGIDKLCSDSARFRKLNPANGWGNYENLLEVTQAFLEACLAYPDSLLEVCG